MQQNIKKVVGWHSVQNHIRFTSQRGRQSCHKTQATEKVDEEEADPTSLEKVSTLR